MNGPNQMGVPPALPGVISLAFWRWSRSALSFHNGSRSSFINWSDTRGSEFLRSPYPSPYSVPPHLTWPFLRREFPDPSFCLLNCILPDGALRCFRQYQAGQPLCLVSY